MKLLYIDPHPVPDVCPESLQILQTVDALAEQGAEVILVTPFPVDDCQPEKILGRPLHSGVTLRHVDDWRGRWWYPSRSGRHFYRLACKLVRDSERIDGLLVRNLKLAEALLGVRDRPPMVFETHEVFARTFAEEHPQPTWKERRKLAALRRRESAVYRFSNGIAALTEWLIRDLREEYDVATRAAVVPDGGDLTAAAMASRKTGWSEPPNMLYLGSLHPWKGVECLIAAMPQIEMGRLLIAGGPEPRVEALRGLATELAVEERVVFLGMVPPAERFHVIDDADICLLPLTDTAIGSRYTSPLKLFEYMAMGKPVVAADVPALRSVIVSGENGILVPVGDPPRLATAVNALLADREVARSIGRSGRQRVEAFSWQARASKLIELFQEIGTGRCVESRAR